MEGLAQRSDNNAEITSHGAFNVSGIGGLDYRLIASDFITVYPTDCFSRRRLIAQTRLWHGGEEFLSGVTEKKRGEIKERGERNGPQPRNTSK